MDCSLLSWSKRVDEMESIRPRKPRRRRAKEGWPCPQVRLLFRLSAILGVSPLVFSKAKSSFSYFLLVYSIIVSCNIAYCGYLNFMLTVKYLNYFSFATIALISVVIYISLKLSSVIDAYINAPKYENILAEIKIIDKKLSSIGVLKSHRLNWSIRLLEVFGITLYCIISAIVYPHVGVSHEILGAVSYALICSQIAILLSHILSRYDLVVRTLEQLKEMPHNINKKIETLLHVNHQLSRVVKTITSCYRLQLLALTTYTFFIISSRLYLIYFHHVNLLLFNAIYFISYCSVQFLRITIYSSTIMNKIRKRLRTLMLDHVINPPNMFQWIVKKTIGELASQPGIPGQKSQRFDVLLYQLMISDEGLGLLDNPKLELHIATKNNVIITACDFFTLDFPFIQTMISSLCTYLVMFIQFGPSYLSRI